MARSIKDLKQIIIFLAEYTNDPLGFVRAVFKWGDGELADYDGPDQWQIEVLTYISDRLKAGVMNVSEAVSYVVQLAVASGHGIGKAHSYNMVLDTPKGITKWGDIKLNDYVFGSDGKPTKVLACHHYKDIPMYRVTFDDGSYTDVSSGHLWNVRGRQERRNKLTTWRTLETIDLVNMGVKRSNGIAQARQWEIPIQNAVEFEYQEVPIAPYVIGTWLGDGGRNSARITSDDNEVINKIKSLGYVVTEESKQETTALSCYIRNIKAQLKGLDILDKYSYEKSVPRVYMQNSSEVRAEVLRGLLDTDGEVTKQNSIGFSSCSKRLAEDVVWLARSLGGKARIQPTVKKPKYRNSDGNLMNGKDCYRVTITMPDGFRSFYINRKQERVSKVQQRYLTRWIDSIEPIPNADGMCITVENKDGLYLANDFIVTHNSALVSWIILWAISTLEDTKGVVTANTETQLKTKTWAELAKWHRLFLGRDLFDLTATALFSVDPAHDKTWRIDMIPWSERNTEAFAGLHNKGKRILIIFDEASAIPDIIWEVTEGALTDENTQIIWCTFGNPTLNSGRFRECTRKYRHRWKSWQIDSRTVKMTNKAQIQQWIEDYGEDSDFVKVRVRGIAPSASDKQFISTTLAEAGRGRVLRDEQFNFAPKIIGVDPAWTGGDETVIWLRQGLASWKLAVYQKNDNDFELAGYLAQFEDEHRADAVFIDQGYGTGLVSAGKTMGRKWQLVSFASESPDKGFLNKRAYMWNEMKKWLADGGAYPDDQVMYDDLIGPEYEVRLDGKIKLESKQDMKKRGIPSPNRADALALTFSFPVQSKVMRAQTHYGSRRSQTAKTKYNPLRR